MKKLLALLVALLMLAGTACAEINIPAVEGTYTYETENGTLPLTVVKIDGKFALRLDSSVTTMTKAFKNDIGACDDHTSGWTTFAKVIVNGYRSVSLRYYVQGDVIRVIATWTHTLSDDQASLIWNQLGMTEKEFARMMLKSFNEFIADAKKDSATWQWVLDNGLNNFGKYLRYCGLTDYEASEVRRITGK